MMLTVEVYGQGNSPRKFMRDFVAVWNNAMGTKRFDLV